MVNPQAKEATDVKSKIKTMLICFSVASSTLNLYSKGPLLVRHSTWCCIDAARRKLGELWRDRTSKTKEMYTEISSEDPKGIDVGVDDTITLE
jgi:hypothetical protein